jgi:hypothetical protein
VKKDMKKTKQNKTNKKKKSEKNKLIAASHTPGYLLKSRIWGISV